MKPNTSNAGISPWLACLLLPAALIPAALIWKPLLIYPLAMLPPALLFLKRTEWILYAAILIAFTRADAWLSAATGLPFGLAASSLMLLSCLLVLTFTTVPLLAPTRPVYALLLFYLGAFLAGCLSGGSDQAFEWGRDASYACLVFGVVYSFSSNRTKVENAFLTVAGCGLLLSLVNLLELFFPGSIQLSHSEGRAAGLLRNANTSAFAVSCCYIIFMFVCRRLNRASRVFFYLGQCVYILGVLATFSRQGLIVISICFVAANAITARNRTSFLAVCSILVLTAAAALLILRERLGTGSLSFLYSLDRITSFLQGNLDDNDRWYLAKFYLAKAMEHPLLGYGFNATTTVSTANHDLLSLFGVKGPHNTPIALWVEFGILPLLLYGFFFSLIYVNIKSIPDRIERRLLLLLFFMLLLHNCFAHDLPITRFVLALLALLALPPSVYSGRRPN
jgi:O-antigen ligase